MSGDANYNFKAIVCTIVFLAVLLYAFYLVGPILVPLLVAVVVSTWVGWLFFLMVYCVFCDIFKGNKS